MMLTVAAFGLTTACEATMPVITITTDTTLNAREKVEAHMKTEGFDGPIGIKLRGNSSLGFNRRNTPSRHAMKRVGRWM